MSLSPEAGTGREGHPGQELVSGPRSLGRLLSRVVPSQMCMIFQLQFSFALSWKDSVCYKRVLKYMPHKPKLNPTAGVRRLGFSVLVTEL